ncbi:MAG: T9SS type A sorting domain-containing protein [Saprospiraceae bacterium]|nr:T9SS type A sorting domain-containing protein [Saprospiraceae bacterium]
MRQFLLLCFFLLLGLLTPISALHSGGDSGPVSFYGDPIEVQLFPNPTANYFQVKTDETVNSVEVFNLLGRKMVSFDFEPGDYYDISELPNGLYLIQLVSDNHKVLTTRRLKKQ